LALLTCLALKVLALLNGSFYHHLFYMPHSCSFNWPVVWLFFMATMAVLLGLNIGSFVLFGSFLFSQLFILIFMPKGYSFKCLVFFAYAYGYFDWPKILALFYVACILAFYGNAACFDWPKYYWLFHTTLSPILA